MRNGVPVKWEERASVPEFTPVLSRVEGPVPREYRHDGWTPERQRGQPSPVPRTGFGLTFIKRWRPRGSVTRAAA